MRKNSHGGMYWDRYMQAESKAHNKRPKTSLCWCEIAVGISAWFGLPISWTTIDEHHKSHCHHRSDCNCWDCLDTLAVSPRALKLLRVQLAPASETHICRITVSGARRRRSRLSKVIEDS